MWIDRLYRYQSFGLTLPCIRQLIPLYVCTALGCGGALLYLGRLALRSPDVSWNKKTNPEPWQEYRNKQYKVLPEEERGAVMIIKLLGLYTFITNINKTMPKLPIA